MRMLVGLWRLAGALAQALRGWAIITWRFPRLSPSQRQDEVQAWARGMLAVLGIGLQVQGTPAAQGPVLLVSNHVSWLDILVLHSTRYCRFVSKADVHHWPLIGPLATGAGTLYIERASRRDAMRVVHQMAERLRQSDVLAVFPEGTTSDGEHLLPFHANLLQAAIAAEAPVQPVALQFVQGRSGVRSRAPNYVGDDTLLGSVWRTVRARGITVRLVFGAAQDAAGRDRRVWAADLRAEVERLRRG